MTIQISVDFSQSFGSISKDLRKESRSIKNRVQSIFHDSKYVLKVAESFNLPLVANERCGRWYIPPELIKESVYFKSTDGHTNVHSFSTRRLNLHLLDFVSQNGGCVIVDSTRRGKPIPDALSKTIPQWCRVINLAVFGDSAPPLTTSPIIVGKSEQFEIEKKVDGWLESFLNTGVDVAKLKQTLQRPLKPIWITPKDTLHETPPQFSDFYPLVLCTASEMVQDGTDRRQGYTYVQGAADDHEEWAAALTADLLWGNRDVFGDLGKSDSELQEFLKTAETAEQQNTTSSASEIKPTGLYFGCPDNDNDYDAVISVAAQAPTTKLHLHKPLMANKKGSKDLRAFLPIAAAFYKDNTLQGKRVLVSCDSGDDLSVGLALSLFCQFFNEDGSVSSGRQNMSKDVIRRRLVYIIQQHPKTNPSRATLNSVNSHLMG